MTFFCSLCNVRLNTQKALCSHYESYSHHDKLLQYAKYLHQQEKQTDAIRNNNSDIIMATEENISDEEVRHRIDKVISNNDSLVNFVTLSDIKSYNKSSSSASKNESKGASSDAVIVTKKVDSAVKYKANESVPSVVSRKVCAGNDSREAFPVLFIDETAPSSKTLPSSSTVSISSDQALPASVSVPTIILESSDRVHIASEPGRSDAVPVLSQSSESLFISCSLFI